MPPHVPLEEIKRELLVNKRITKIGCWESTTRQLDGEGKHSYLAIRCAYKKMYAHRIMIGARPGQHVMHLCDIPACYNPAHLRLGTQAENMRDAAKKKRTTWGEHHPRHKLTIKQIRHIRSLKPDKKYSQKLHTALKLAKSYGVHPQHIRHIWNRRTWYQLED